MAAFREHMIFSSGLGFLYGGVGRNMLELSPAAAIVGAGLTAVGGMLPDLDSSSGKPVREIFGLAAVIAPLLMIRRLIAAGHSEEELIVFFFGGYAFIRYVLADLFKRFTVHRGMFHSIPAMLIAGLIVFIEYETPNLALRCFLAIGVSLGFLSHLVLDEIYSIDFNGVTIRLNQFAGSAVKFYSKSYWASVMTYILLGLLSAVAWNEVRTQ